MKTPRILAPSGGYVKGPVQMSWRLGTMLNDAAASTDKVRPRVCLINTAMGDSLTHYSFVHEAFNAAGWDVTEFKVFPQPSDDPEERLSGSDLVWVGGGSIRRPVPPRTGSNWLTVTSSKPASELAAHSADEFDDR